MNDEQIIELPDGWKPPEGTLAPLLDRDNVSWLTLLMFVLEELVKAGNGEPVLVAYRDEMTDPENTYSRKVRISMAYMGEMELEHDSPTFE